MEERTLQFFASSCGGRLIGAAGTEAARRVSTDSRAVEAGDLFVALAGEQFDGHDFLGSVRAKGAAAAVIDEQHLAALPPGTQGIAVKDTRRALGAMARAYRADFDLAAIAVAGSNGKTSTKELVASVLREAMPATWSAASFNNDIGVPLSLLGIERGHRAGVFEAGTNHPGELRPLLEMIQPSAGIITSIGREHLEFFGSLEGVLAEEGTLAEMLPARGFLLINGDGYGADALARRTAARVVRVGGGPENDWRITSLRMDAEGTAFTIEARAEGFSGEYHTTLLGKHQVANATYAIAVGKELGLGRAEIQRGLASCPAVKQRLQLREIDGFLLLDDAYNANADSMRAALETLESFPCRGRRIAVLGDMAELGPASAQAHAEVGRRAAGVDCLVAVGKSSGLMASAARGAGAREVVELAEPEEAGPVVTDLVRPGDVVLVKASRSSRLERVVEFIAAQFAPVRPAAV